MKNSKLVKLLDHLASCRIVLPSDYFLKLESLNNAEIELLYDVSVKELLLILIDVIAESDYDYSKLSTIKKSICAARSIGSANYAGFVAIDENVKKAGDPVELIQEVAQSKSDNASIAYEVATNENALRVGLPTTIILTDLTGHAGTIYKASAILSLIKTDAIWDKKIIPFAKLICSAKCDDAVSKILEMIKNEEVRTSPHILRFLRLVSGAESNVKAVNTADIIMKYTDEPAVYELANLICHAKSDERSTAAFEYADSTSDVHSEQEWIDVTRLIANSKSNLRAEAAKKVALDNDIYSNEKTYLSYIRAVANARGNAQATFAAEVAEDAVLKDEFEGLKLTRKCAQLKTTQEIESKMAKHSNSMNIEAALALVINGIDLNETKNAELMVDVITDDDAYINFTKYYEQDPIHALDALKDFTSRYDGEFSCAHAYVKKKKEENKDN